MIDRLIFRTISDDFSIMLPVIMRLLVKLLSIYYQFAEIT